MGDIGWNWVNIGSRGRGGEKNESFGDWIIEKEGLEECLMSEKLHKIVLFSGKTARTSKEQAEGRKNRRDRA